MDDVRLSTWLQQIEDTEHPGRIAYATAINRLAELNFFYDPSEYVSEYGLVLTWEAPVAPGDVAAQHRALIDEVERIAYATDTVGSVGKPLDQGGAPIVSKVVFIKPFDGCLGEAARLARRVARGQVTA